MVVFTDVHGNTVGVSAEHVVGVSKATANHFDLQEGLPEAFIRILVAGGANGIATIARLPVAMSVTTVAQWIDAGRRSSKTLVADPDVTPEFVAVDGSRFGPA